MSRLAQWLARRVGGATALVLACLAVGLVSAAWTLSAVVRGLDFELLATMAALGGGAGWLLARSRLQGRVALGLALALAFGTVCVRVGQLGDELLALGLAAAGAVWQLQYARLELDALPGASDLRSDETLTAALVALAVRLHEWAQGIVRGQPVYDPVAAALVWSLVLWGVAAWAAWMLRRRARALTALAPLLLLLGLVLAYSGRDALVMVLVIGAALALLVIVSHLARKRRWQMQDIPYAEDLGVDLALVAVPAILCLLAAVTVAPAFSPREIARWVQSWSRAEADAPSVFSDSLGLVPAPRPATVFDEMTSPGMPRRHLLGAPPELLAQLALIVETDDPAAGATANYYWLGSTYDVYTGHGWGTSPLQTERLRAGAEVGAASETYGIARAPRQETRLRGQTVRVENGSGLVYAAGTIQTVDHDLIRAWRSNRDLFGAQVQSEVYHVESRLPAMTAAELRARRNDPANPLPASSAPVPTWIQARYLALPDTVPPRVLALARDLTATAPTPYDRALALEDYLHTFPYTLALEAPPPNRDVVDYFLFDLQRGYCDYYASAMTVLARAAGLPARLAVGYATGAYNPATRQYIVTEAEAHSWTQVYFPEYGWVDFEPTTGRAGVGFPEPDVSPFVPPDQSSGASALSGAGMDGVAANAWLLLPAALLALGLCAPLLLVLDVWRLQRLSAAAASAALYGRVFRAAHQLGLPVTPSYTPHQLARLLQGYSPALRNAKQKAALWRPVYQTSAEIIEAYVQATYGAQAPDTAATRALIRQWQKVRPRVWVAVAVQLLARGVGRARGNVDAGW